VAYEGIVLGTRWPRPPCAARFPVPCPRGQHRPGGHTEPAIVTTGVDHTAVRDLITRLPAGEHTYTAQGVVAYLLGE
jgi:hypothetical protein